MTIGPEEATTADQRLANEQLVLNALRALGQVDELEEQARERERLLHTQAQLHLADRRELQSANQLATLGKLTASVAHELGTPLAVIRCHAQMLASGDVPADELAAEARVILEQVERMTRMVKEVLAFGRPRPDSAKATLDLAELVSGTVSMLSPLSRGARIALSWSYAGPPALASGEPSRLIQIVSNLIINAGQAMPGGGRVELTLTRRRGCPPGGVERDYLALDVIDHGPGMTEHVLANLFAPFFTTRGDSGGTGLGLAVSQRIAHEHGGFIGVRSAAGVGSCVTLYLPEASAAP